MHMRNNFEGVVAIFAAVKGEREQGMSARFSKLEAVDLADEEDTEAEGGSEDCQVALVLPEGVRKGRKRRIAERLRGKKVGRSLASWRWVLVAVVAFAIAVFVALMVARLANERPSQTGSGNENGQGAVATDSALCSEMSGEILRSGGSAVDAAITALLCVGAVHPESSGIGGGGFMVVYSSNGSTAAIDFREAAPAGATTDMFHSNSSLSTTGGLAVAVPGELRGMELSHRLYGRLEWSELFEPVINLCQTGFNLSLHTAAAVRQKEAAVRRDEILTELFVVDGRLKQEGELVKRPRLADTLELISRHGADAFYTGKLAENTVRKVNETGGILTLDDLANYQALHKEPIHTEYNGYTLHVPPPPSGGPELLFPLNLLSLYNSTSSPSSKNLTYHHMVEAFKFMFALRSQLGDTECAECDGGTVREVVENMTSLSYAAAIKSRISDDATHNVSYYHAHYPTPPSDHGTTHISVLSPDGMAVSVTSTVNTYFGSKVVTDDGVVLNDEMDDFSSPNITNSYGVKPSETNFISPGKRPLSSTCPLIAVKRSEVGGGGTQLMIAGASGGTRIPTATAQVVWRVLSLGEAVDEAIEKRRLHHQLSPNQIYVEDSFPDDIIAYLESKGHSVAKDSSYAVVQGVCVTEVGVVSAHSDSRKQGRAVVVT